MRAALFRRYGPPESLELAELPDPEPRAGQVAIAIRAASVNFPDVLIAANRYQVSAPLPLIPGSELSGVVAALGEGVSGLAVGDEVTTVDMTGAFAERIAVDARRVQRKPPQLSHEEAAALGVTYRTAVTAVRTVAEAKPGEWVAVLGAAGGVGSACLDVAKRLGARTLAIVSSEEKARACLAWGADAALRVGDGDLKTRIREITGGEGADVALDPVGGALAEQALRGLRWRGRFVVLGFASGEIPRIPLNLVLLKNVQIRGVDLRGLGEREPATLARDLEALAALVAQGLRPRIGARFALADAAAALRVVAERRALGKVVVVP